MSSNASTKTQPDATFFQENLIPADSSNVRFMMKKAGQYARSDNLIYARIASVAFAALATIMSFFNSISYLLQTPFKFAFNIFGFSVVKAVMDFVLDLTNVVKSLMFVVLGVSFVVIGLIIPEPIFTTFAPECYDGLEIRLQKQVKRLQEQVKEKDKKIAQLEVDISHRQAVITDLKGQLDGEWRFC